jgi:hypothetical protein
VMKLQDTVLDGKYLDRAIFDNLTESECVSRYTAPFITSGAGFGVPTPESRQEFSLNASFPFGFEKQGSGDLRIKSRGIEYACELRQLLPSCS